MGYRAVGAKLGSEVQGVELWGAELWVQVLCGVQSLGAPLLHVGLAPVQEHCRLCPAEGASGATQELLQARGQRAGEFSCTRGVQEAAGKSPACARVSLHSAVSPRGAQSCQPSGLPLGTPAPTPRLPPCAVSHLPCPGLCLRRRAFWQQFLGVSIVGHHLPTGPARHMVAWLLARWAC